MANYETVGEVGHALEGVKNQISLYGKIITGMFALAVTVSGALFVQVNGIRSDISDLAVSIAKNDIRMERMESLLAQISADAAAIKSATETASYIPPSKSSSGYTGIEGVASPKDDEAPKYLPAIGNDGPVPAN